jgi:hypothetical protein
LKDKRLFGLMQPEIGYFFEIIQPFEA